MQKGRPNWVGLANISLACWLGLAILLDHRRNNGEEANHDNEGGNGDKFQQRFSLVKI
jgi:hypothetical protein